MADVVRRLTEAQRVVLAVLDGEAMRGLDIVRNSGGLLKRGTIYVVLSKMEEYRIFPYDRNATRTYEDVAPLVWSYWFGRYLEERGRIG